MTASQTSALRWSVGTSESSNVFRLVSAKGVYAHIFHREDHMQAYGSPPRNVNSSSGLWKPLATRCAYIIALTECSMPENPQCMTMRPTAIPLEGSIPLEDSRKEWQQEHIGNPVSYYNTIKIISAADVNPQDGLLGTGFANR